MDRCSIFQHNTQYKFTTAYSTMKVQSFPPTIKNKMKILLPLCLFSTVQPCITRCFHQLSTTQATEINYQGVEKSLLSMVQYVSVSEYNMLLVYMWRYCCKLTCPASQRKNSSLTIINRYKARSMLLVYISTVSYTVTFCDNFKESLL